MSRAEGGIIPGGGGPRDDRIPAGLVSCGYAVVPARLLKHQGLVEAFFRATFSARRTADAFQALTTVISAEEAQAEMDSDRAPDDDCG